MSGLWKRIINLREALDFPPCKGEATLDELLLGTLDALPKMCPGNTPSTFAFPCVDRHQKPIFQKLQRFYKTLRAIEDTWVDSLAHKGGLPFGEKWENDPSLGELESSSNRSIMRADFKNSKSHGHKRKPSEEASDLEQLSKKNFDKLDMTDDTDCRSTLTCEISLEGKYFGNDFDIESKLDNQSPITPTSVLPESTQDSVIPGSFVNAYVPPLLWPPKKFIINNSQPVPYMNSPPTPTNIGPEGKRKTCQIGKPINHDNLSTCENPELQDRIQNSMPTNPASISRQPLQIIENTIPVNASPNDDNSAKEILLPQSKAPPPPSPPPPPPAIIASITPPPLPPLLSNANKALRPRRSNTKLKRSSQIGNLYRYLEGKVERAGETNESLSSRRKMVGHSSSNSTQGMAEVLAEITRRSSYFQKIEEDTQRFATPIMEMKHAIESFQTRNMDELLKFHRYVELHLEDLTDETQVLARFEGFPTKKLEIIRSATALYSKLSSIADQLATWKVMPPLSLHLDKVTCYFDKIKEEVETLDRVKDEESKRFESHKIFFDFNIIIRIKETMVDVSSDCIALALQESKTAKGAARRAECHFSAGYELCRCLQMLWKTFQLSFRVYKFAGGQDDRAEELTCALAKEMETYPQHYWNLG